MSSPLRSSNQDEVSRLLALHAQAAHHSYKKGSGADASIKKRMDFAIGVFTKNQTSASTAKMEDLLPVQLVEKMELGESALRQKSVVQHLHANKEAIYHHLMDKRPAVNDTISIKKFQLASQALLLEMKLPSNFSLTVNEFLSVFPYLPSKDNVFEVTLNFSDPQGLFYHAWSDLFAQDEIQTMEFPLLLHLKEHLAREKPSLLAFDEERAETTLVKNVPRMGHIDSTDIYGSYFGDATKEQVVKKTRRIDDPKRYNILALPAFQTPSGSTGEPYKADTIQSLFEIAYLGFKSLKMEVKDKPVVINTGNWGGGAFGHDPLLMAVIQILAARVAGIEQMNYYLPDWRLLGTVDKAQKWINEHIDQTKPMNLKTLFEVMAQSKSFIHGASDGN